MSKKIIGVSGFLLVLTVSGILAGICIGAKSISLETVYQSIFHYNEEVLDFQLLRNLRIPRVLAASFVGGFLGISGAMLQGVTRNPIAEPSIMGITQGATLLVTVSMVTSLFGGLYGRTAAAFIGAAISGLTVLFFGMQNARNMNVTRLLLVGTAFSTLFISLSTILAILFNRSQELVFWVAGGFRTIAWGHVKMLLIVGGISSILSIMLSHKINIVNLGEDIATGLGVNPAKIRMITILLIIPLCAVSVSAAGNIAFIGLVIPHIFRKILGNDYRLLLPFSFLGGSALLIWSDIAARMVTAPYEMPVGLFTSLIGIPVFLYLIRKEHCQ